MERASKNVGCDDRMASSQGYDPPGYASAAYQAYCNRVCSFLKKATKKEKASLSEELYDHMESHAEALVELGWDPEEARIYAIQAMGDAEIVGKQYDEKLSSFWLWCGYVVRVLCVGLTVMMLSRVIRPGWMLQDMVTARWAPSKSGYGSNVKAELVWSEEMNLRVPTPSGKHVIRVYLTELYRWSDGSYGVQVFVVSYPKNPLGSRTVLLDHMTMDEYAGGGYNSPAVSFRSLDARVEKGQESVELVIYREVTGTDIRVDIPLNWEDIP